MYIIAQPPGSYVSFEFVHFDIEGSYGCVYDNIEIRDGDSENSTLIGRYCGDATLIPPPSQSTHNYVWIKFVTDGSIQNHGFQLNYTTHETGCGGILKV